MNIGYVLIADFEHNLAGGDRPDFSVRTYTIDLCRREMGKSLRLWIQRTHVR